MSLRQAAELLVRGPGGRHVRYPVQVSSVSAQGAGLSLLAPVHTELENRQAVIVSLMVRDRTVELPAHVVRFRSESRHVGLFDVGLVLHPEAAPATMRTEYQAWLADLLAEVGGDPDLDIELDTGEHDPDALEVELTRA